MAQLVLIRHGQAAAFSTDSDRLPEAGERQARVLGDHWAAKGVTFDAVYSGSLRRHAQTEAQVAAAYRDAGKPWPSCGIVPGWNEYDAPAVLQTLGPALALRDPEFQRLVLEFTGHAAGAERNRYFQRMFEALMACWVGDELEVDGVEGFAEFHGRVAASLAALQAGWIGDSRSRIPGSRGTIAVFTSGGPIGVCVQQALKAPKASALDVNWRVRNASLTEFLFGKGRLSLDLFNATAHLSDDLVSYR